MKNAPVRHRLEHAAYRLVRGLLRALPHTGARRAGLGLGSLAWLALGGRRKTALENLRHAFPDKPEAEIRGLARESLRQLGLSLCDALSAERFDAVEFCRRLELEGFEHLREAEAKGRGVFVMSAHLGCWEAAALPVGLYQGPMDVVGRPLDNPFLDRDLTRLRTRFGNRILDKRGAARGILRALKSGGRVGILIDQRSPAKDAIEVPLFGRPSRTSSILGRISLRTGAPVVPLFGFPAPGGRWHVAFRPAIEPPPWSGEESADEEAAVFALTCRYMEVVEAEVRARPASWMWVHRRWRP